MAHIAYVGTSDVQEFSKGDVEKFSEEYDIAEDDHKKLSFKHGEVQEVPDTVADWLTSEFGYEFKLIDQDAENKAREVRKAARKAAKKTSDSSNAGTPARSGKGAKAGGGGDPAATSGAAGGSDGSGASTGGTST